MNFFQKLFAKKLCDLSALIVLCIIMITFLCFAFFGLAQFETSDEHFWKNERIPHYWQGLHEGLTQNNWQKMYINDKPGATLALVSGVGLLFLDDSPTTQFDNAATQNSGGNFRVYDVTRTEKINFALRTPLVLFTAVLFCVIYYVLQKLFSRFVALSATLALALSPPLLGLAQILNPDSLLWPLSFLALLGFYGILTTQKRSYLILTAVACGFALLSKYTANILFLFFFLLTFFHAAVHYTKNGRDETLRILKMSLRSIVVIMISAYALYAILFPVVFTAHASFLAGTLFSPVLAPLYPWLTYGLVILIGDLYLFKGFTLLHITAFFGRHSIIFIRLVIFVILLFFVTALFNALSDASLIPLDNLKERIDINQKLNFEPLFAGDPAPLYFVKELLVQSFGTIFALHTSILTLLILTWLHALIRGIRYHKSLIPFLSILVFIFLFGGLFSEVFVTVRYALIAYTALIFVAILGLDEMLRVTIFPQLKKYGLYAHKKYVYAIILMILFFSHVITLAHTAPHHLNYHNTFLPKDYVVTDSWSYGIYEAAHYLNELPNASTLTVWSDRSALCRYFIGHCITRKAIDRQIITPDYFLLTRRNVARQQYFTWKDAEYATLRASDYYTANILNAPAWELQIHQRPKNYIKLIPSREL